MKPEKLLQAMDGIKPEYIAEAKPKHPGSTDSDTLRSDGRKEHTMKSITQHIMTGAAVAAAIALCGGIGVFIARQKQSELIQTPAMSTEEVEEVQTTPKAEETTPAEPAEPNFLGGTGELEAIQFDQMLFLRDADFWYLYTGTLKAPISDAKFLPVTETPQPHWYAEEQGTLLGDMKGHQLYYVTGKDETGAEAWSPYNEVYQIDSKGNRTYLFTMQLDWLPNYNEALADMRYHVTSVEKYDENSYLVKGVPLYPDTYESLNCGNYDPDLCLLVKLENGTPTAEPFSVPKQSGADSVITPSFADFVTDRADENTAYALSVDCKTIMKDSYDSDWENAQVLWSADTDSPSWTDGKETVIMGFYGAENGRLWVDFGVMSPDGVTERTVMLIDTNTGKTQYFYDPRFTTPAEDAAPVQTDDTAAEALVTEPVQTVEEAAVTTTTVPQESAEPTTTVPLFGDYSSERGRIRLNKDSTGTIEFQDIIPIHWNADSLIGPDFTYPYTLTSTNPMTISVEIDGMVFTFAQGGPEPQIDRDLVENTDEYTDLQVFIDAMRQKYPSGIVANFAVHLDTAHMQWYYVEYKEDGTTLNGVTRIVEEEDGKYRGEPVRDEAEIEKVLAFPQITYPFTWNDVNRMLVQ